MNLLDAIKRTPDTVTENGAPTFSTTYNANLDFFAQASAKRAEIDSAENLFVQAFIEDRNLAVKNLFYLRDVRAGSGERAIFLACMSYLIKTYFSKYPTQITDLLANIPEFGRWKDLFDLIGQDAQADEAIFDIARNELARIRKLYQDKKPIDSLFAKWFPLAGNVKNPVRLATAKKLCGKLYGGNEVYCRKEIVAFRKNTVVEQDMSAKNFSEIVYEHVPSCAFLKYRNAFLRNDKERFTKFLQDVEDGKKKINTDVLYPHEIVARVRNKDEKVLDTVWKNLPPISCGKNALCVVDTSGSMMEAEVSQNVAAIDVSVGLGIYLAEHATGVFKDCFITFSEKARLVQIKGKTIAEKVRFVLDDEYVGNNTNLQSVFDLILQAAVRHNLDQSELPETIYIISDMEFDSYFVRGKTNHELVLEKYRNAGYMPPTLVYWNVASRGRNVPTTADSENTILVSGFSPKLLTQILSNAGPVEFMRSVLLSERYKKIHF